jgi:hypothetical protein
MFISLHGGLAAMLWCIISEFVHLENGVATSVGQLPRSLTGNTCGSTAKVDMVHQLGKRVAAVHVRLAACRPIGHLQQQSLNLTQQQRSTQQRAQAASQRAAMPRSDPPGRVVHCHVPCTTTCVGISNKSLRSPICA